MENEEKTEVSYHLDKDPNDPRNLEKASTGFSLTNEPEAELQKAEVEVQTQDNIETRVGADPNDVRLVA